MARKKYWPLRIEQAETGPEASKLINHGADVVFVVSFDQQIDAYSTCIFCSCPTVSAMLTMLIGLHDEDWDRKKCTAVFRFVDLSGLFDRLEGNVYLVGK